MMRRASVFVFILFCLIAFLGWSCKEKFSTARVTDSVDYNLHIRPILSVVVLSTMDRMPISGSQSQAGYAGSARHERQSPAHAIIREPDV
jgi:hypothetical protein